MAIQLNTFQVTIKPIRSEYFAPVLVCSESFMRFWEVNESQYFGFDRAAYEAPCYCWFEWLRDIESKRIPFKAPLSFELSRVYFDGKKLEFSDGRNRVHWLIGRGLVEVPVFIGKPGLADGKSSGLILEELSMSDLVTLPIFDFENAALCDRSYP